MHLFQEEESSFKGDSDREERGALVEEVVGGNLVAMELKLWCLIDARVLNSKIVAESKEVVDSKF